MPREYITAKYDANTLTVDFVGDDGTHVLRTGGTIAWRFNNPCKIRAEGGTLAMGAIGIGRTVTGANFLIFRSYQEGRYQQQSMIRQKYNNHTILAMVADLAGNANDSESKDIVSSPSNRSDRVAYANAISLRTGLPITTKMRDISEEELQGVLDSMENLEGFHELKETRRNREVATTSITITDGIKPRPGVPVQIKIGAKIHEKTTDEFGQLPKIAHTESGKNVALFLRDTDGTWSKQFEFSMDDSSGSHLLTNDFFKYRAPTAPKKPPASYISSKRIPFDYTVGYNETLAALAERFATTIEEIANDNPVIEKTGRIYVGQMVGIYGPPSNSVSTIEGSTVDGVCTRDEIESPFASDTVALATPESLIKGAYLARSKNGQGEPLAVLPVDQTTAPWMAVAIEEAQRWAGEKEDVITRTENFHKLLEMGGKLTNTPWCAAFVNYCLKISGTLYEKSASSQFPCWSNKFKKIDKPVYGAILIMRNYVAATGKFHGSGHVTFVYGLSDTGAIAGLGGNQGDRIKISPYQTKAPWNSFPLDGHNMEQKVYAYYVPVSYWEFAMTQEVPEIINIIQANKDLLNIVSSIALKDSTR